MTVFFAQISAIDESSREDDEEDVDFFSGGESRRGEIGYAQRTNETIASDGFFFISQCERDCDSLSEKYSLSPLEGFLPSEPILYSN